MTTERESSQDGLIWCLDKFSLVEVLSDQEQDELHREMSAGDYRSGTPIYRVGDPSDTVYKLHYGLVRLTRPSDHGQNLTVAILGPGQIFGETSLADEPARQWIAETLEDSRVCWISKSALLRFAERNPKLSFRITKLVGDRLTELDNRLSDVLFLTARGRLARVLLKIGTRFGAPDSSKNRVRLTIALTHQDLAELIGSTRETASTAIGDLRRHSLINTEGDTIALNDVEALSNIR
ncbi:MAG: Crp/Fnr family transcriptional regulator [Nitrospira sp.]|nr:MAG: Crp/Fnr family transcriptional regulator [Nitrospira sp.]